MLILHKMDCNYFSIVPTRAYGIDGYTLALKKKCTNMRNFSEHPLLRTHNEVTASFSDNRMPNKTLASFELQ